MSYLLNREEIVQTNHMIDQQHLDVRTITMGINLQDCASEEITVCGNKIYDKICSKAENLVKTGEEIEREFGIPIVNKRISVTPISIVAASCKSEEYEVLAKSMDRAAKEIGVNYIGGYSALVQKGFTESDRRLIRSIPTALAETERVCSSGRQSLHGRGLPRCWGTGNGDQCRGLRSRRRISCSAGMQGKAV